MGREIPTGFVGWKHSWNFGCLIRRQLHSQHGISLKELLEIGPWSWNFTGGEFPNQWAQGKEGCGNWRAQARPFPLPTKSIPVGARTTSLEKKQLKCSIQGGHLGKIQGFWEHSQFPSLPSINPKENPTLLFLVYGFVLQEGWEENPNPHSHKYPLWDLFPVENLPGIPALTALIQPCSSSSCFPSVPLHGIFLKLPVSRCFQHAQTQILL